MKKTYRFTYGNREMELTLDLKILEVQMSQKALNNKTLRAATLQGGVKARFVRPLLRSPKPRIEGTD